MTKPWIIQGAVLNPFTNVMRAMQIIQSKRSAKIKRSHKNKRQSG